MPTRASRNARPCRTPHWAPSPDATDHQADLLGYPSLNTDEALISLPRKPATCSPSLSTRASQKKSSASIVLGSLVDERVREVQRLEKELQDAGIKLSSVASRLMTKSGRAMVEALIRGERDPKVLANLAQGKMRRKIPHLEQALVGRFSAYHAVIARQVLAHVDFLDASVAELDQAVRERMGPFEGQVSLLVEMVGWGRGTAEVFLAETGGDMARFPSAQHLASWCRICPANNESAGKHKAMSKKPGKTWLGRALIEAAKAAARTNGTYFAAQYRQVARRRGPNKAAVAVANSMVVTAWHILTTGEHYHDLGPDFFRAHLDPMRAAQRKLADLRNIGWAVTTNPDGTITVAPPELAA